MQQPVQIAKIENEKIAITLYVVAHGLDTAMAEACIQFLLIHSEARRKTHQHRSEKAPNEDSNQNLGYEFWQCGSRGFPRKAFESQGQTLRTQNPWGGILKPLN